MAATVRSLNAQRDRNQRTADNKLIDNAQHVQDGLSEPADNASRRHSARK
ncbi:hypothetical protein AB0J14_05060 [Micromonospora arborensis]